jgi:hypothetical protein
MSYKSKSYDYNGTPADCRPANKHETVIEVVDGPNRYGEHTFFAYWEDTYMPPSGVRGQIFLTSLSEFIKRTEKIDGSKITYRLVDRRR